MVESWVGYQTLYLWHHYPLTSSEGSQGLFGSGYTDHTREIVLRHQIPEDYATWQWVAQYLCDLFVNEYFFKIELWQAS